MAKTYTKLLLVLAFVLDVVFCDDNINTTTEVADTTTSTSTSVTSTTNAPEMTTTTTTKPTTPPQTAIQDLAEMLKNLPVAVVNAWAEGAQAVENLVESIFNSMFAEE